MFVNRNYLLLDSVNRVFGGVSRQYACCLNGLYWCNREILAGVYKVPYSHPAGGGYQVYGEDLSTRVGKTVQWGRISSWKEMGTGRTWQGFGGRQYPFFFSISV